MKRFIISLFLIFATWQAAFAMSYERAREEALYLTDKMAYELNLNDQQYNDAYEINLDYFLSLDSEADLYADYLSYRLSDLRHILYDWQYNLMLAADYFIRPVYWRAGGWYFPIYAHYTVGHFYYSYPTVYYNYRGGHGRIHYHNGFYASRRPVWNGGFRSHQPIGGRGRIGHTTVQRHGIDRMGGNRYPSDANRRGYGRSDRGNSFGNSSSRNPRNDYSGRGNYGRDRNNRPDNSATDNRQRPDNSDLSNRNHEGTVNSNIGRSHEGINRNYESPRNSGVSRDYSSSRSSMPSRSGMSSSHSSSPSRSGGSFSGGSRGGSFSGGSRGGGSFGGGSRSGGGGASRGGRR